jgi:hypothetical protein
VTGTRERDVTIKEKGQTSRDAEQQPPFSPPRKHGMQKNARGCKMLSLSLSQRAGKKGKKRDG